MMARAAGMGVAAGVSSSAAIASFIAPWVSSSSVDGNVVQRVQYRPLHLPLLLAANWCSPRQTTLRMQSLAPSALYCPSKSSTLLNSALSRTSGYLRLGLSVLRGAHRQELRQGVCGAARGMAAGSGNDLESWIKKTNTSEPVVVYSKSYCPYCMRVKKLLSSLGYDFDVIELDAGGKRRSEGQPGLQDALERVSGQYTVPNVFIGGKHIGGCDDTIALHSRGELEPLLQAAGANRN